MQPSLIHETLFICKKHNPKLNTQVDVIECILVKFYIVLFLFLHLKILPVIYFYLS